VLHHEPTNELVLVLLPHAHYDAPRTRSVR
jgi:hypothetical protein